MSSNICVVTSTRAEFGLLKPLIRRINNSEKLSLSLLVTGAHLSPEFGFTKSEVEEFECENIRTVEMLLSSDSRVGVVKSAALGMLGFADSLTDLKPDLLIVLGDRYEMLAAAFSAVVLNIPVAHIHGGEKTVGAYDDAVRHAITKFSSLHFTSNDLYRRRVIQLGESPESVFETGPMIIDSLAETELMSKKCVEEKLNLKFKKKALLVVLHSQTLSSDEISVQQAVKLIDALSSYQDTTFIVVMPNADNASRRIRRVLEDFVGKNDSAFAFKSLTSEVYLSCLAVCDAIIGNSSSGILEAPLVGTWSVNIGSRQQGRIKAQSVVDVPCCTAKIKLALDRIFQKPKLLPGAADKTSPAATIVEVLESVNLKQLHSEFYDVDFALCE